MRGVVVEVHPLSLVTARVHYAPAGCGIPIPPAGDTIGNYFRLSDEFRSVMRRMDFFVHERESTADEIRRLRASQATALSRVVEERQLVTDELLLERGGFKYRPR